jgi:hypothetical protein
MAVARYYSSNAVDTTLAIGCNSSVTSITVSSVSGFPTSYPYTLAIDYDTSNEELVDVTAATGTNLTIVRGVDSTTAVAHSAGAVIKHAISGRDMREAQEHIGASAYYSVANGTTTENFSLHGLGASDGNVVGTAKTQTLTNKTLTSPTINGATLGGTTTASSGTIALGTNASAITAYGYTVSAAEVAYLDGLSTNIQAQLNAKAPLASPTFTGTVTIPTGASITAPTLSGTTTNSGTISGGTVSGATLSGTTTATSGTIALGTNANAFTANSKTITAAELSYLDNLNQNVQDTFNSIGVWSQITSGLSVSGAILSLGNGSLTGRICYINKTAHIELQLTIGSTTTFVSSTIMTITLPVGAESTESPTWLTGNLYTASGAIYNALNCRLQGTSLVPFGLNLGTSVSGELTALTSTSIKPLTTGSVITINGTYETV